MFGGTCTAQPSSAANVLCTHVQHVREAGSDTRPVDVNGEIRHARLQQCNLQFALAKYGTLPIRGFSEWRQRFSDKQTWTPSLFYHPFLVLEVPGGMCIGIERYNGRLELSFGMGSIVPFFAEQHHAGGFQRAASSFLHERVVLNDPQTTVGSLVTWLSGPLAKARQPYSLLRSNCQHFVGDLIRFLHDPVQMQADAKKDRDLVMLAVREFGSTLELAAPELQQDREVVLAAVRQDGMAIRHADGKLRADRQVVFEAVCRNGLALQFADEQALDLEVVLAAVQQNGVSLWLVPELFRANRHVALAAVKRTGVALQFVAEHLRADREIAEAAVLQCGMAFRFVLGALRHDVKVARIAVQQTPAAAKLLNEELRCEVFSQPDEPTFSI